VQIRTLQKYAPPVRIISSGRVYRPDEIDATHSPMFHQIEGLVIEPGIHMGHLKGVLTAFLNWFFGERVRIQLRPTFFPFTEPSADVHIVAESVYETALKNNTTIPWLEVLGCGMVHPKVLKSCGLDSKIYQGFAFGMGLERLTMLKQGWSDIRELYKNDVRWLLKNNNIQKHAEGDK
jgi:phenylalanyl-tRNA synthetase alpha chain